MVVGPSRHGVVRHGLAVAAACAHPVLHVARADEVRAEQLTGASVVHVPFTDRLFGATMEAAVETFRGLAALVRAAGANLSVTLHDVPHDDSPLQRRRAAGYREVIALADGVVVNSGVELAHVEADATHVRSLRLIPLPVPDVAATPRPVPTAAPASVGLLGFVYPDRGYEQVLAAVPAGCEVVAVGEASAGHDDEVDRLAALARDHGATFRVTGYVDDATLAAVLAGIGVPVAPNRRVTASASLNTWAAHGRRVIAADGAYARELERGRPGSLLRYDPDDPAALAALIAAALADADTTWLDPADRPVPDLARVAAEYTDHLASCRPPRPVEVDVGHFTVADNRWDLLTPAAAEAGPPAVTVVVPYYAADERAQPALNRTLTALAGQRYRRERLEVVVADDGSPVPPDISAAGGLRVRVVRQDDRGFRAGTARNLGASIADGDVLAFLDADMMPERDFVAGLCRLPGVAPDVLTVGRRRHAELADWTGADVRLFLRGERRPDALPEPQWLAEAYAASLNLLDVDQRSYRYVISAVLAMHRNLFAELGGFDESFEHYGGEDWELAHRAYVAGALFAHLPDAVAWHDGPDWAGRTAAREQAAEKQLETATLARLLPDPAARAGHAPGPYPAVVVDLIGLSADQVAACIVSARGHDCAFWTDPADDSADRLAALRRAGFRARVDAPADLGPLWEWCRQADRVGEVRAGPVTVTSSRIVNRTRRWADAAPGERWSGRHDRTPSELRDVLRRR